MFRTGIICRMSIARYGRTIFALLRGDEVYKCEYNGRKRDSKREYHSLFHSYNKSCEHERCTQEREYYECGCHYSIT